MKGTKEVRQAMADRKRDVAELRSKQKTERGRQAATQKAAREQLRAAQATERKELSEVQKTQRTQLQKVEKDERWYASLRSKKTRKKPAKKKTTTGMAKRLAAAQTKARKAMRERHAGQRKRLAEAQRKRRTGLAGKHKDQLAKVRERYQKLIAGLRRSAGRKLAKATKPRARRAVAPKKPRTRKSSVPKKPRGAVGPRILRAFTKLDKGGRNMVTLAALRAELADVPRSTLDSAINDLRRARKVTLEASDQRHVRLSSAELGAAILEGGQRLVYMARLGAPRKARKSRGGGVLKAAKKLYESARKAAKQKHTRGLSEKPKAEVAAAVAKTKGRAFRAVFAQAFDRARDKLGRNLVPLATLRSALSSYSREDFDAGLRELRRERLYSLSPHEGRSSPLPAKVAAAGINEAGRLLVYVADMNDPGTSSRRSVLPAAASRDEKEEEELRARLTRAAESRPDRWARLSDFSEEMKRTGVPLNMQIRMWRALRRQVERKGIRLRSLPESEIKYEDDKAAANAPETPQGESAHLAKVVR